MKRMKLAAAVMLSLMSGVAFAQGQGNNEHFFPALPDDANPGGGFSAPAAFTCGVGNIRVDTHRPFDWNFESTLTPPLTESDPPVCVRFSWDTRSANATVCHTGATGSFTVGGIASDDSSSLANSIAARPAVGTITCTASIWNRGLGGRISRP